MKDNPPDAASLATRIRSAVTHTFQGRELGEGGIAFPKEPLEFAPRNSPSDFPLHAANVNVAPILAVCSSANCTKNGAIQGWGVHNLGLIC